MNRKILHSYNIVIREHERIIVTKSSMVFPLCLRIKVSIK